MKFDQDGDGLIENSGFADQTYDGWTVTGPRWGTKNLIKLCFRKSRLGHLISKAVFCVCYVSQCVLWWAVAGVPVCDV